MNREDAERISEAALAVAAVITPLTDEFKRSEVDWSRSYLVGFITTLIGLHFMLNLSRLADSEMTTALGIAWTEVTGTPWTDEFQSLVTSREGDFEEGANNASRFVRSVHFEGNVQGGAALWREVFVSRAAG